MYQVKGQNARLKRNFSAVGYFFAKRLQEDLKNVPIGLIGSNCGGTPAEIWMPEDVIQKDPVLLESAKTNQGGLLM
ncbi:hypothetical protein [Flavobacterium sp. ZS1P14]|uniref:hypothetical protein n=1 Tax=Flavobacterium sp. ZS1P14 TaxID=3401729 RepID=UPI003AAD74A3